MWGLKSEALVKPCAKGTSTTTSLYLEPSYVKSLQCFLSWILVSRLTRLCGLFCGARLDPTWSGSWQRRPNALLTCLEGAFARKSVGSGAALEAVPKDIYASWTHGRMGSKLKTIRMFLAC